MMSLVLSDGYIIDPIDPFYEKKSYIPVQTYQFYAKMKMFKSWIVASGTLQLNLKLLDMM